jgi:hypothetical protein
MTIQGKAAEHALLQKLASFTKIPKAEFVKEPLFSRDTREELPVFRYPILAERLSLRYTEPYFHCVSLGGKGTLNLAALVDPAKWLKCPLREAYCQGEGFITDLHLKTAFCLSTYLVGMVWVTTYHQSGYAPPRGEQATGGVIVRDPVMGGTFLSQPVRNFMVEILGVSVSGD